MKGSRKFVRLAFVGQVVVGAASGFVLAASTPPDMPGFLVSLAAMACGLTSLDATRGADPRARLGRAAMRLNAMMVALIVLAAALTLAVDHQLHVISRQLDVHLTVAGALALPFVVGWAGLWWALRRCVA